MKKGNIPALLFSLVMIPTVFLTACGRGGPSADSSTPVISSAETENISSSTGSAIAESTASTAESSTATSLATASPAASSSAKPASAKASSATPSSAKPATTSSKTLVAYFSRVGNTNFSDNVDVISSASLNPGKSGLVGSTEIVARQIHDLVGGDLVEIQTVDPYPADYEDTVWQNVDEAKAGFKPELKTKIKNMDSYDTIYLGYPTWAMDIPRPIASFLSQYDFKGKTIIPFNTNGGYGLGSTVDSIKKLCPDATMLDAFEMPGANARDAQGVNNAVSEWLRKIGTKR